MSRPISTMRSGKKVVATAGTRVQLADASTNPAAAAVTVVVQALGTNTGVIVVGDSNVVAGPGTQGTPTQRGIRLAANDTIALDVVDISTIWIDCVTNGDGVSWIIGA